MADARPARRIVVAVDGSAESAHALAYAADLVERRGATLDVVIAYVGPPHLPTGYLLDSVSVERAASVARHALDEVIESVLEDHLDLVLVCTHAVIRGHAGDVLVARACGAEVLVVGGHGARGSLARLRLGSVAEHCVNHAPCPVLVVRHVPTELAQEAAAPNGAVAPTSLALTRRTSDRATVTDAVGLPSGLPA